LRLFVIAKRLPLNNVHRNTAILRRRRFSNGSTLGKMMGILKKSLKEDEKTETGHKGKTSEKETETSDPVSTNHFVEKDRPRTGHQRLDSSGNEHVQASSEVSPGTSISAEPKTSSSKALTGQEVRAEMREFLESVQRKRATEGIESIFVDEQIQEQARTLWQKVEMTSEEKKKLTSKDWELLLHLHLLVSASTTKLFKRIKSTGMSESWKNARLEEGRKAFRHRAWVEINKLTNNLNSIDLNGQHSLDLQKRFNKMWMQYLYHSSKSERSPDDYEPYIKFHLLSKKSVTLVRKRIKGKLKPGGLGGITQEYASKVLERIPVIAESLAASQDETKKTELVEERYSKGINTIKDVVNNGDVVKASDLLSKAVEESPPNEDIFQLLQCQLIPECLRQTRSDIAVKWLKFLANCKLDHRQRFGNLAFRALCDSLKRERVNHVQRLLSDYGLDPTQTGMFRRIFEMAVVYQRPQLAWDALEITNGHDYATSIRIFQLMCLEGKCLQAIDFAHAYEEMYLGVKDFFRLDMRSQMILAVRLKETSQEMAAYLRLVARKAEGKAVSAGIMTSIILAYSSQPEMAYSVFDEARRLVKKSHGNFRALLRVYAINGEWRRLVQMFEILREQKCLDAINTDYLFRGLMFSGRVDLAFEFLLSPLPRKKAHLHTIAYAIEFAGTTVHDDLLVQDLAHLYHEKLGRKKDIDSTQNLNLFLSDLHLLKTCPWMYDKIQFLEQRGLQTEQALTISRAEKKYI